MALNPYTLNNLYAQGILDYVPQDLCAVSPSPLAGMQNPYLNSAQQGALDQNSNTGDSFSPQVESAGVNAFGGVNGNIITNHSNAGLNAFGGGADKVTGAVSNGFGKVTSFIDKTPNLVKGIISGVLILGSIGLCLKGKKKPPVVQNTQKTASKWKFWKKQK